MTEPREETYSHSRLTTFTECPRRYRFRYVDKVREAFQSIEAYVGQTVHAVLAWLYETRESSGSPTLDQVVDRFDFEWHAGLGPEVKVVRRDDSQQARRDDGRAMLAVHYNGPFQEDRLTTIATEESLATRIGPGHRFKGIIDRLARDASGGLHVIDFKTTGRPPASLDDETALQIRAYGLLGLRCLDVSDVQLRFHFLKTGLDLGETFRAADVEPVADRLAGLIATAESATRYPPNPSALCAWCGYRERCEVSGFFRGADGRLVLPDRCPRCGGGLRRRSGRRGPFLGCEGYPECRFTQDIEETGGARDDANACPRCGGKLQRRRGRYGEFLGCEGFPRCTYSRDP